MIEYAHIHNAWVVCTRQYDGRIDVRVLVPVGQKGHPGFNIRNAEIKGDICWGHGDKRAMDKDILNNTIKELERIKLSLEREVLLK